MKRWLDPGSAVAVWAALALLAAAALGGLL